MEQGDLTTSYYQYHQSHFQNPNPSSSPIDLHLNPLQPTYASAPPVSSSYSFSDYPCYTSSTYPQHPQSPDHVPNPTYAPNPNFQTSNPSPQPSSFPHLLSQQTSYYPHDQNQMPLNYDHSNPNPNSDTDLSYLDTSNSASYGHHGGSAPPNYVNSSSAKFDNVGGYFDENLSRYGAQGMYGDFGERRPENGSGYDPGAYSDDVIGNGVYAYNGGKVEPYGARGTRAESSSWSAFDDYGRPIGLSSRKDQVGSGRLDKIVKATPKTETQQDVKSGGQKFRVKLLAEGGGQSTMDVLCQIGLDGIRILDPAASQTLRIYPLESLTRWEILDLSIFAFWAKSSIDIEPRRIRLQSNSYTMNNILDTVTAATIQLKEMGERNKPASSFMVSEQPSEKKKGFADWMNLMKPGNEEKDYWVPDEAVTKCMACSIDFGAFVRKHHCRNCGDIFCDKCSQGRIALTADEQAQPVRVCDRCMAEVTQRLSNVREEAGKIAGLRSHEDLAQKLEEEMDRKRKTLSGLKTDGSGLWTREVACPTCTVHLQIRVPASGSETIECSVCQHPFLVSAN